ncbi:MAG: PilZ domain-containing protein [Deltaproteobacteria bacterium]|nr:MAG: PilZ domain-containing protein [Deltaproteobacteria bacterium]
MEVCSGRRSSLRILVDLDARCNLAGGHTLEGKILNLSTGGLCLKSKDRILIRESLVVEFKLPGTRNSIRAVGDVVFCRFYYEGSHKDNPVHVARIKFTNLPPLCRSQIQAYTLKLLWEENLVRSQGIHQLMAGIRDLPTPERLRAYNILIKKEPPSLKTRPTCS